MKKYCLLLFVWFCLGIGVGTAQYTVLHDFNDTLGSEPNGLILSGNTLYGMTVYGGLGRDQAGTVYSIDTNGTGYRDLLNFNDSNGAMPLGSLVFSGNHLYGTTSTGFIGGGDIFSINTNGTGYKDLFNFNGTNGDLPIGTLVISGSKLYGMTSRGGTYSMGNIFSVDTDGRGFKNLLDFNDTNGQSPWGSLTLLGDKLYGMASQGGANHVGCIFSIDTDGSGYKDLHDCANSTGSDPKFSLIFSGSKLYGMMGAGAINGDGCIFSIDTNGSEYKDIFDFNVSNGLDGSLIIKGNTLCGVSTFGGANSDGFIFSIDTNGTGFKDLFDFNGVNGNEPSGPLVYAGGVLYGTTAIGGDQGVIFSFTDIGLGINEVTASSNSINIYPNPSTGIFTIALSHPELVSGSQTRIEVYNLLGEQVYDGMLKQVQHDEQVDISNQPSGVYFYRVIKEDGSIVGSGKMVIEK